MRRAGVGLALVAMLMSGGYLRSAEVLVPFEWGRLASLPDTNGVAGCYAGVSSGALLVAGGANFPDRKPWEGGRKAWHDTVFALGKPDGTWRNVGRLPRPLAYGISVTTREGVLCAGGSDAERHHADVFLLALVGDRLTTKRFPSLPLPLANAAGALVDSTLFVFGGSASPGEQTACNRLFSLDLAAGAATWSELEPCPGKARILPVAAACEGLFIVAGGAALEAEGSKVARVYLRDAWSYRSGGGWRRLADLPKPIVAAPSPAPVFGSRLLIVGGDDGSLAGFEPVEKHPGFPRTLLAYDLRRDQWTQVGEAPISRATLPSVWWQDRFVLPSGEMRPGVRSPEVWTLRLGP